MSTSKDVYDKLRAPPPRTGRLTIDEIHELMKARGRFRNSTEELFRVPKDKL